MRRCVVTLAWLWIVVLGTSGEESPRARLRTIPGDELFRAEKISRFKIKVDEPALAALNKDNRAYVPATVTVGTNVFTQVGIHLKGMGSFRPLNEKPSFAVKFDKYVADQTYLGLSKIMLNNSSQDGTYLAELVATSMFRDAGIPAARVTHAFVEFNGRDLGLYVVVEAINKDFLMQHFKSAKGNLYEAYLQDIDQTLDLDHGVNVGQADLKRLLDVTGMTNAVDRWQNLQRVLDVERFLTFTALEMFASHTDGYARNRNNYRLYHDPGTDRFVFITHGLDWGYSDTGVPVWPPMNSIVVRAVLQTPEGRRLYRERLGPAFTNFFRLAVLTNRVQEAATRLRAGGVDSNQVNGFVTEMNNRLVNRARNIARQLAAPDPLVVKFSPAGVASVTEWQERKLSGEALIARVQDGGRTALKIGATNGPCVASWRAKVWLDEGSYVFQGIARTSSVEPLPETKPNDPATPKGMSAGLRVSGQARTNHLHGDTAWTLLDHPFHAPSGGGEVDLICELRAQRGEVWFDASSLRLIKK